MQIGGGGGGMFHSPSSNALYVICVTKWHSTGGKGRGAGPVIFLNLSDVI